MARIAIKPELTTRELYDLFWLDAGVFSMAVCVSLFDNGDIVIDYNPLRRCGDDFIRSEKDKLIGWLKCLGYRYTLPPFESNFIDRSQL